MKDTHLIRLSGIVERVTFHNADNGWSVLKVSPFSDPAKLVTVVIHQAKVFAGSTMEFWGAWTHHPKHGEQFKAEGGIEKKPATSAALEKYLGSGLIRGVGPKTATKIVKFFKENTLQVFEERIDDLQQIPGIAEKKILTIKESWLEHKAIRDVMMFLQGYGISTLFAVKIYKAYGNSAISVVSRNPYQLAKDIYGIGFFSADKIALALGFERHGEPRMEAGIRHVLAAAREEGHCYLTEEQIHTKTGELLQVNDIEKVNKVLASLVAAHEIKQRLLSQRDDGHSQAAYYSKSLYFEELFVANRVKEWAAQPLLCDVDRVNSWIERYLTKEAMTLSAQQVEAIVGMSGKTLSILTGGPGCGKTTTTRVLVKLAHAMGKRVVLVAPTGRAAQRMTEVIGMEAKTIHRLLEWAPAKNGFKKDESDPLKLDMLVVDECSMLDISLAAALFKAVPRGAQVVLIGDPDQLPSVGAGQVLQDLLRVETVASFRLTKVFRQAEESLIIRYAHEMNRGEVPRIDSPLHRPSLWKEGVGCLFIDSEEATQEQLQFLQKARAAIQRTMQAGEAHIVDRGEASPSLMKREGDDLKIEECLVQEFADSQEIHKPIFTIPEKFKHIDLQSLYRADGPIEELKTIVKSLHPWSALHYGMTSVDMVLRLYTETIPKYYGKNIEIQVLSPQVRGSLGTLNLNLALQRAVNPERQGLKQIQVGDRIFREGDRIIQMKNNYDLGVFNGDIGNIRSIDLENYRCEIEFGKQTRVSYEREDLAEISLAYGITIHKSQGSEFEAVIIPVNSQHFKMLFRNLLYTGLTRAKRLCVFVGSRKALALAVRQVDNRKRQTALSLLAASTLSSTQ